MTSQKPKASRKTSGLEKPESENANIQMDASDAAVIEKSALDSDDISLMEAIVDEANFETAWKKVKANRGAPGPAGNHPMKEKVSATNGSAPLLVRIYIRSAG